MITSEFFKFFENLEINNNKNWFDENKKDYENFVKKPFFTLVEQTIDLAKEFIPNLNIIPKECLFRINRDIRFSNDKTPYKLNTSAAISPGGKKDYTTPSIYFEINKNGLNFYTGVYGAEKENLMSIREYLAEHSDELDKIINSKNFVKTFNKVLGEKNKKLPKEFNDIENPHELLYNKSFYVIATLSKTQVLDNNDLANNIISLYKQAIDFNNFFRRALGIG